MICIIEINIKQHGEHIIVNFTLNFNLELIKNLSLLLNKCKVRNWMKK